MEIQQKHRLYLFRVDVRGNISGDSKIRSIASNDWDFSLPLDDPII